MVLIANAIAFVLAIFSLILTSHMQLVYAFMHVPVVPCCIGLVLSHEDIIEHVTSPFLRKITIEERQFRAYSLNNGVEVGFLHMTGEGYK